MTNLIIESVTIESEDFKSFMKANGEEIETIFPYYYEDDAYYSSVYLLKMGVDIIGVFIYQSKGDELHVDVDFIIKEQRDKGVGADFFKRQLEEFKSRGFKMALALATNLVHIKYLSGCGFKQSVRHPDRFELILN